ncbi:30S ribosomal protein S18 [Patescibacteria group bacterium]|nr:30S ribosomal protein S18 [Patescibacteria group bacterium]
MKPTPKIVNKKTRNCHFCSIGQKEIDYKDMQTLQRFISSYGKIVPRRKSGTCTKHQRKLAQSIKRARFLALLPYTTR